VSETVNDWAAYQLSAQSNLRDPQANVNGNLSLNPHYAQVGLNAGVYGQSRSYGATVRGGLVGHAGGVTFSAAPVQDTFGIVKVGDVAGVKISTPSGPAWTNFDGQAVMPSLPPYADSRVELVTRTLPRNVDIRNGFKSLRVGRGSVSTLNFDVLKVSRMLLTVTLPDGTELPKGTALYDAKDNFVTAAGDHGMVFLPNGEQARTLHAQVDGTRCAVDVRPSGKASADEYYEAADVVCKPQ